MVSLFCPACSGFSEPHKSWVSTLAYILHTKAQNPTRSLTAEAQFCAEYIWPLWSAHTTNLCQAANHNGLVENTGASQFCLATFLSLSLSIISVPHCTLCILLPFAVAGAASWVCRCCWSHWAAAQQLANPTKLLSCSARVHLSFCLLQPPVGFCFF